ncbi:MAG: lipoyl synthase [Candidatus Fraserbacteria bacterium RBG_16_55_9]|uniref:Lipoyl synthase n=1 Tax=Fraserbacteria sp. (strain RBG_16_55_9) TaxID=1817864 RepID=A0A1F5UNK3_FRAXR|nr:MAG: lipoyl synthase [Candidatus Fraserbacteria bacterium RBG_16_55_9]
MPTDGGAVLQRKPEWLKIRPPSGENYKHIKRALRAHDLHTVCEEARCPNVHECWGGGTATIMLMGGTCTRGCRFCAVTSGHPHGWLDPLEPWKVAKVLGEWGLEYVVLTSVARDDLADGGAGHFAQTVRAIKEHHPKMLIEVLIPDFQGNIESLKRVVDAKPDVIGHNIETVERLTPKVRDRRANYHQSLAVLQNVKLMDPTRHTKSSIMVGLGETETEVMETMRDLRSVGVDILTVGQYLRPTQRHLEVREYVHPDQFARYEKLGEEMGFLYVASGPLVRSSYRAGEFFLAGLLREGGRVNGQEHRV